MSELKAYKVDAEEHSVIVFAKSGVTARREGACEMDAEFEDVISCRRAPEFDSYAEQGSVPSKVLVEDHGWYLTCKKCGTDVHSWSHENKKWLDENTVICGEC